MDTSPSYWTNSLFSLSLAEEFQDIQDGVYVELESTILISFTVISSRIFIDAHDCGHLIPKRHEVSH